MLRVRWTVDFGDYLDLRAEDRAFMIDLELFSQKGLASFFNL